MSIFSKLRNAKKAADQHKGKGGAVKEEKKEIVPYRHVPTHAAIDALSGAPSSWKNSDREAIKIQNKRRSQLSRNYSDLSATTNATSLNRNNSSLSYNTHDSQQNRPRLEVRRSHMGYAAYEGIDPLNTNTRISRQLGKSPLGSHQISPVASSTSSSSSQILELPPSAPENRHSAIFDKLNEGSGRKIGEAPYKVNYPVPGEVSIEPAVTANAIELKKKSRFNFGRKSNAIAAH